MQDSPLKVVSYEIQLPQFQGPFDLLLFFIERDELDIYDIPIARITDDFLGYIHQMEKLNIDLAAEFILVASTLMRIKARTLLPRREKNEEGEEIDPREELVQRLLEYKRYKSVLADMRELEEVRRKSVHRGYRKREAKSILEYYSTESELHKLSLYKLLKSFHKALEKQEYRERAIIEHQVVRYPFTIKDEKQGLRKRLLAEGRGSFEVIFQDCDSRIQAVFRFLALLELIQERVLSLQSGKGYNQFFVSPVQNDAAAA